MSARHRLNSLRMPTGDRLTAEPDAGNLHVRFDEGEQGRPLSSLLSTLPRPLFGLESATYPPASAQVFLMNWIPSR